MKESDHNVLHVRYNHTYGEAYEVVISFTVGTATAPEPVLTATGDLYSVSWAGLSADPPVPPPAPPPPPTPTPPPPTPPTKTYQCQ